MSWYRPLAALAAFAATALLIFAGDARASLEPDTGLSHAALYGATAIFRRDLATFPQWQDAMARAKAERSDDRICTSAHERGCVPREWHDLIATIKGQPLMTELATVNAAINRHPYVPTWQNWHRTMYWETPFEFLERGGQCQDYAIAKYLALHEAGLGDDAIRMLVVRDTALGVDHAVLVAYVDGTPYLLDNLHAAIRPASRAPEYRPYYAISLSGYWMYFGGHSMVAQANPYRWQGTLSRW